MAYQQYDNRNYQQPPQPQRQQYQQSYDQGHARQPGGYQQAPYNGQYNDQQYDYDYGYDQGQYEQWDDGYYDHHQHQQQQQQQQQGGGYGNGYPPQQRQDGYDDMNAHRGQPPQGQRPPHPHDQYSQEQRFDDRGYQQPQGRGDPRNRQIGSNGAPGPGPAERGMQRDNSRGQGDRRPQNLQQGHSDHRPPRTERALMSPVSPQSFSQDNPFPTFPSQKPVPRAKTGSMDEAMSLMNLGQDDAQRRPQGPPQGRGRGMMGPPPHNRGPPPQHRGPPPGRGGSYPNPDMQRQDSGHFEGNGRGRQPPAGRGYPQQRPPTGPLDTSRVPQQRPFNPESPSQQRPGPNIQRAQTLPQERSQGVNTGAYNDPQGWADPGPAAGYHGPESPTYIPPRPSTASGTKNDGYQYASRPNIPPLPPLPQQQPQPQPQSQQYLQPQDDNRGDIDNLYDDYYGVDAPSDRKSHASSIDMPNFDAIPDTSNRHRRGFSIDNHLSPVGAQPDMQPVPSANATPDSVATQQPDFYQQAAKSRSQPDLHSQYSQGNGVYEMAGDAPAVPPLPAANTERPILNGLPSGPRGKAPPMRGLPQDPAPRRGPTPQGYAPGQGQNFDPKFAQQQPPFHRGDSGATAYSEPGVNPMRNGSPMVSGNAIPRPGTAAPAPTRMPVDPVPRRAGTTQPSSNPDALPAHPLPVRAGLNQQPQQQQNPVPAQAARPPPVRQYHTDPTPTGRPGSGPSKGRPSAPHPVTHDELNRLRNTWKANPSDSATGIQLAKKLVEAATVLADEGGTADNRTKNKNREKFIFEAHKTVKKMVAGGSPDAMFYLADCYGSGQLGLQVDTKEAFVLYQSAAKAGHAASAYRTAVCCEMGHEEGGGTKRDPLKAVQWYRRAAALGDTPALYKMGMILLKGLLGQQKNLGEAINMLKRAADRADEQNPHALHELALLYEAQTGNERIIRDESYSAQLFMQAAELGYKFSQFRLGQAFEYGLLGYPVDARSSIGWYTRAAAQEEHQSELALSGWYLTGSQGILEQSDTEAYLWARRAACAEPPLSKALFAMGYFTEVGIGCPRSLEEAKRWYGRAASYKFPKAQERLEELKRGGAKAQKGRERLSRTNQKQHDENCTVM
ncbi:hypothetical protein BU24DRAFT_407452 [Aaosphaeria arxii CBS 175.79]|uniref:HCP-like protein n=1 Tax=Aaosphaeria arxii CBS 175.79 TaxID=1450172 RepID=A0A6A5XWZ9_9PLEO|nr:uncharacterized protein BU24DRAFT_407452 [Aaosphaeria arxii CBS 175.79]KAF2017423.1 hypothetical protein BU24DRAFT_407452 [Aaosphaeria arxii CBS 175.79]